MRSEMMRAWLLLLPLATRGLLLSPGVALRCARSRCPASACQKRDDAGFLAEDELGDWVNLDKSSNLGASATGDMPAEAAALIARANESPESIEFEDTIGAIDAGYDFTSVAFEVGPVSNAGGTNMGSAKIFSLAKLGGLSADATLHLFGRYYRDDVLKNPDGDDHANIRAFQARAIRATPGAHDSSPAMRLCAAARRSAAGTASHSRGACPSRPRLLSSAQTSSPSRRRSSGRRPSRARRSGIPIRTSGSRDPAARLNSE